MRQHLQRGRTRVSCLRPPGEQRALRCERQLHLAQLRWPARVRQLSVRREFQRNGYGHRCPIGADGLRRAAGVSRLHVAVLGQQPNG